MRALPPPPPFRPSRCPTPLLLPLKKGEGGATYRYNTLYENEYLERVSRNFSSPGQRHLQNNYDSSLFPSAIVRRRGPLKREPNFEIHCAPLCAAALISGARRERGAYDALKMDKTGRLNIRRAVVQKFTSVGRQRATHRRVHKCTYPHVHVHTYIHTCIQTFTREREKEQGKGARKWGRGGRGPKRERGNESRESIEPT